MRYVALAILTALIGFDLSLADAAAPEQRESLRELQGVEVLIEDIKSDAQADGLSQEAPRAAFELIIRSRGIRVLTPSEGSEMLSKPFLYVYVGTDKNSSGQYVQCKSGASPSRIVGGPAATHVTCPNLVHS